MGSGAGITTPNAMEGCDIRVMVVDDHEVVREAWGALIELTPGVVLVGEAGTGEEAISEVSVCVPDVVLMDICMPGCGGIEACRVIRAEHQEVRVLVVTAYLDSTVRECCKVVGASGSITKRAEGDRLMEAIRLVAAGETLFEGDPDTSEPTRTFAWGPQEATEGSLRRGPLGWPQFGP